jgi:hypothetical protein
MKVRGRRGKMANGGGAEESLAVVPVEAAVTTEPQMLVGARMVGMPAELLDCHACHLALKPPIFKVRSISDPYVFFLLGRSISPLSKFRSCFSSAHGMRASAES